MKTVAELLPLLPKTLRSRHALNFDSLSLQHSDFQRPRVLLISPKAKFIMTFNGAVEQPGFETIETMRFTNSENRPRFIFEEIVMEGDLKKRRDYLNAKGDSKASAELVERSTRTGPNPELCLTCHRADPRPNWEHYSFWPRFYGQFDDRSLVDNGTDADPTSGEKIRVENAKAAKELLKFVRAAPKNPRYRQLIDLKAHTALENPVDRFGFSRARTKSQFLSALTHDLAQLNFSRITRMIRESEHPERYRLLMLINLAGCALSPAGTSLGYKKSLESFYQQYGLSPYVTNDYLVNPVPRLAYLFQDSKLPWEDFFMNLYPGPGNRFVTPFYEQWEFSAWLIGDDAELNALYRRSQVMENGVQYLEPVDRPTICEKLTGILNSRK